MPDEAKPLTPKEKAEKLVAQASNFVHGYVGSSMLSNTEYPEQILKQAKKAATVIAGEVLDQYTSLNGELVNSLYKSEKVVYWQAVKTEIQFVHMDFKTNSDT